MLKVWNTFFKIISLFLKTKFLFLFILSPEILPSFETEDEKLMARACAREIFVETDPKGRIAKSN